MLGVIPATKIQRPHLKWNHLILNNFSISISTCGAFMTSKEWTCDKMWCVVVYKTAPRHLGEKKSDLNPSWPKHLSDISQSSKYLPRRSFGWVLGSKYRTSGGVWMSRVWHQSWYLVLHRRHFGFKTSSQSFAVMLLRDVAFRAAPRLKLFSWLRNHVGFNRSQHVQSGEKNSGIRSCIH